MKQQPFTPRIYISAGEPSGDLHGAGVVEALRKRFPGATIESTGGPRMAAAGAMLRHSIDRCDAMGLIEVAKTLPRHWSLLRDLKTRLQAGQYDLIIVIDYPGFHFRLARAAAENGVPVLYYVAPQLWAWGASRSARLRRWVREVAVILPFEEEFFRNANIPATFVGHPLLDRPAPPSRAEVRNRLGIAGDAPVLALFPGSREQEHERIWPIFRDAARLLRQDLPNLEILVAGSARFSYVGSEELTVLRDRSADVLSAADAVLCKSGTATLEAALANVPMVIAYRMNRFTFALARRVVRTKHVGLVNLVAGRGVAPELLQDHATPAALANAVRPLLDRESAAARLQYEAFPEIVDRLGTPGAGNRVAEIAASMVA
jgi:lipid-A-disaccharide synthase